MSAELTLTREERRQVFAGTLHVLRREIRPYPLAAGQRHTISSTRRLRQIVDRDTGAVIEIPPVPNLWITVKGWTLKDGEWEISVTVTDERQPVRRLAWGAPSAAPRQSGLKTRQGSKVTHRDGGVVVVSKRVPKKGEDEAHWTRETERGYGGTDGDEAVDDWTLELFSAQAEVANEMAQEARRDEGALASAERDVVSELNVANLSGARAAKRRAERVERRLAAAA